MYEIIRDIRDKYPFLVNIVNNFFIYPFRKCLTDYRYKKTLDQVYKFNFEGEEVNFFLPFRHDLIEQTIIAKKTFFEVAELKILRQYISPKSVIIDIGANIGNHLVFFGKFCNASKIIAFEPNPILFPILERNIVLNQLDKKTTIHQVAIGSQKGKGVLLGDNDNKDPSYTNKSLEINSEGEIKIAPLDDLVHDKVDLLKIDVEGLELEVLKGASQIILRDRPIIFIESLNIDQIMGFMAKFDYRIETILSNYNYILIQKE